MSERLGTASLGGRGNLTLYISRFPLKRSFSRSSDVEEGWFALTLFDRSATYQKMTQTTQQLTDRLSKRVRR